MKKKNPQFIIFN